MTNDLKVAIRTIWKKPLYAISVISVMALSIGACTAVFSIFNAVLRAPLPFKDADRLAIVWHTLAREGSGVIGMSPGNFVSYAAHDATMEGHSAVATRGYNLGKDSNPVRVTCARVTAGLLPLLHVAPETGRWFSPADDSDGAQATVILSHRLWQSQFAGNAGTLGSTIHLDLKPYTVIGVMPDVFRFPLEGINGLEPAECYVPAAFGVKELATPSFNIVTLARLKSDATLIQANDEANLVAKSILESYPAAVQRELDLRARVVLLTTQISSGSRSAVFAFSVAVAFLLLIGCANVANLILARMQQREREFVIRTALGSSRWGLIQQTLTECSVLALSGGVIGTLLAWLILRVIQTLSPGSIPRLQEARIDAPSLVFTVLCSLLAGLLIGVIPAIRTSVGSLSEALMSSSRGASSGISGVRIRGVLMSTETAITLVLLIGASLLLQSFMKLSSVPAGFSAEHVLTFSIALPPDSYSSPGAVERFTSRVLEQLRTVPPVSAAAVGSSLPLGDIEFTAVSRLNAPEAASGFKVAAVQIVSPGYHQALGIALTRGRLVEVSDIASTPAVAVINETMARRYWPDADPLGASFSWIAATGPRTMTVVGVARDLHESGLDKNPQPLFYVPLAQSPYPVRGLAFVVKTAGAPEGVASAARSAVASVDRTLPVFGLQPMQTIVRNSIAKQRFNTFLIGAFACGAALIAGLGIYAVIAYLSSNSAKEIAIRAALGGQPAGIVMMIIRRGLSWVGAGIVAGLVTAILLGRFLSTLLYDLSSYDTVTYVVVSGLLLAVSLAAMAIPALRATKVDPASVLRYE